ncbi:MAG: hypothetical protein H7Y43_08625, partial [Akkermansiaceae bacterium]|nr:hypothetical protein [Verrucomicrobiales bacterium]
LSQNQTIDATGLPGGIQFNGNNASRVFFVNSGVNATLTGLILTNGTASQGGAIQNLGNLTLNQCTLVNNLADCACGIGGGAVLNRSNLIANNSTFIGNAAGFGGAIFNDLNSTLTINQSTFSGNIGTNSGGAIYNFNATMTVSQSTVVGNQSPGGGAQGGGINNNGFDFFLTNSIVCSNTASSNPNIAGVVTPFSSPNNLVNINAQLAPLGNYGGLTPTMPPLPNSPALNAVGATSFATDQRGFTRPFGPATDIGAVEVVTVVSSTADNNTNTSLRGIIVGSAPGQTNTFAAGLSGQTIVLTNSQLSLNKSLTLDGSALPNGITISGNNQTRIFEVFSGSTTLNALTLTNGNAQFYNGLGGGILVDSNATLVVNNCAIVGNVANFGGGILSSYGNLTVNNSTVASNSAVAFAGLGGGIYNFEGVLTLRNCTVSGNSATTGPGTGGGVYSTANSTLLNTIVAANIAPNFPNVFATGAFTGANNLTNGNPLLAPLGNYGGPTPSRPPLPGSPAVDQGAATPLTTDQRGYPRSIGAQVDIGAVEVQSFIGLVTTNADNGALGSLRSVLAGAEAGSTITFAPGLSGQTILLTNGQIVLSRIVSIDGSTLINGVQINGSGASRLFFVNGGVDAVLNALTLTNGNEVVGGAINNNGTLTINQCTLAGNRANTSGGISGGAILNRGLLAVRNSTLAGNTGSFGGAIFNDLNSTLTVGQSTFTGNVGTNSGGAIYNFNGTMTVNQSTVVGNQSPGVGSQGGGINNNGFGFYLTNSIVCGNTASSSPNIAGVVTPFSSPNNLVDINAQLAPPGNYGGPTPTLPPLPGSPVIDGGSDAAASTFITDQRGLPRLAGLHVDIGAVELQTIGVTNPPVLTGIAKLGNGSIQFNFTNLTGAGFTVLTATNVALPLSNWTVLGAPIEVSPGQYQFTDAQATNNVQRFYRVRSP